MEIKINKSALYDKYTWTITDDFGAMLERGEESTREAAQKAAEMAAAWIQSKTINDYYGG